MMDNFHVPPCWGRLKRVKVNREVPDSAPSKWILLTERTEKHNETEDSVAV